MTVFIFSVALLVLTIAALAFCMRRSEYTELYERDADALREAMEENEW